MAMASSNDDYYSILGINQSASQREVRKAYLQLIVGEHPDKGGNADKFAAIQKAYAVLSDPSERVIFDEQLERRQGQKSAGPSSSNYSRDSRYGAVSTSAQGVTAYVHGQTRNIRKTPGGSGTDSNKRQEAAAGQRHNNAGDDTIASTSETIARIKKQLQEQQQKDRLAGKKYRNNEENILELLAAAYIERGAAHLSAGRLHHAEFDSEEALSLCPGSRAGRELLEQVQTALEGEALEAEIDNNNDDDSSSDGGGGILA